jgi:hypothetical protein
MGQYYSDPKRESDTWSLPDVWTVYHDGGELGSYEDAEPGWYWAYCFPGCLPDSDFYGPYGSEEAAIEACRNEQDQ